jgi:hypothetical protein
VELKFIQVQTSRKPTTSNAVVEALPPNVSRPAEKAPAGVTNEVMSAIDGVGGVLIAQPRAGSGERIFASNRIMCERKVGTRNGASQDLQAVHGQQM